MADQLKDKVAVITGAASGIGLATVRAFLAEGAKVIGGDIQDERGRKIESEFGTNFRYMHADVTIEADISALVDAAVEHFGRLDCMFNNAGAVGDMASILDVTSDGFDRTMALITRSVLMGHKYAARQFIKQKSGGSIISTASLAGIEGGWSPVCYNMGKHAVVGLVKQATAELAPHGIRCNAVAPGIVPTGAMAGVFGIPAEEESDFLEYVSQRIADQQPIGRTGRPEDIASSIVFLASDASSFITGQNIAIDGGATTVYQGDYYNVAKRILAEFSDRRR